MPEGERRLAAIMFTDMVGYTSLSQKNEFLAMELLEEHRKLVRQFFPKHNGREIKTMGDGFLVEFASALAAMRCAFEIQQSFHELNSERLPEKKIILRIGIHVGDVIVSQNDVYGDAVNIASRIEPLATSGGICVTKQVSDHIKNKFELSLANLGNKELKHVGESVEVFRVIFPWEKQATESDLNPKRIAVLPFISISADPNDEYFADGLTEELIDRLSQVRELQVIARTSIMGYKNKEMKATEIGRELSVGTLVEGSVRKAGNKIRVTAQLIDSNTERHLWSSRYDKDLEDIFAIQSDIAEQVARSLALELLPDERSDLGKKATSDMDAYLLFMKGRHHSNLATKQDKEKAIKYYRAAVELDPDFALAYAGISQSYHILGDKNWLPPEQAYPRMKENAIRAVEIDPGLSEGHAALAAEYMHYEWKWQDSEREFKRAIELNPSYAPAYSQYGNLLALTGRYVEALENDKRGYELDPQHWVAYGSALAYIGNNDEAIAYIEEHLRSDPENAGGRVYLGAALYRSGRTEEAISELKKAVALSKDDPSDKAFLAIFLALSGQNESATFLLDELLEMSSRTYVSGVLLALVLYVLGRQDEAFEKLELAFERKNADLTQFECWTWHGFQELHKNHRWISLKQRMGL